jgi:hypothetical protein
LSNFRVMGGGSLAQATETRSHRENYLMTANQVSLLSLRVSVANLTTKRPSNSLGRRIVDDLFSI